MNDFRYNNAIKSMCERKSLFIEWSKQKEKHKREEMMIIAQEARKKFLQLLESSDSLKTINKYSEAEKLLEKDPRWNVLECNREREEVFRDYLYTRIQNENANLRKQKQDKMSALKRYLQACEWLDSATEWRKASRRLEG